MRLLCLLALAAVVLAPAGTADPDPPVPSCEVVWVHLNPPQVTLYPECLPLPPCEVVWIHVYPPQVTLYPECLPP